MLGPSRYAFEPFDCKTTNWNRYCQQLKFYLSANKIKPELELATILSLIGTQTFNLLCDLIAPQLPENLTVIETFKILENHFSPKPISRVERFKLKSRKQEANESIADFVAALRKLSLNCGYKDDLDLHLSDQFVFGLANPSIQKRLLAEEDKTSFKELIHIASVFEMTARDSATIAKSPAEREICKIQRTFKQTATKCKHCGSEHASFSCRFKDATCHYCKKKGHILTICRARNKSRDKNTTNNFRKPSLHSVIDNTEINSSKELDNNILLLKSFDIKNIESTPVQPFLLNVKVNNINICFEIDTGASISLLPWHIYEQKLNNVQLEKTNIKLNAFSKIIIPVGKIKVDIEWNNRFVSEQILYIIKDCTTPLLGRTWIQSLNILKTQDNKILIGNLNYIQPELSLKKLLEAHSNLFSSELGHIKDFKVHISLKEGSIPKFFKYRQVPFALLPQIEAELEKLVKQDILEPIKFSEWASPIVPIQKKDKSLRICADYKVGLNPCLKVDQYPLPLINDILSRLAHGTVFTKLDLSQAYQQVLVDDSSTDLLTINTHKGLFKVKRLPFGIASAPAIFQQLMDKIINNIPNTICYLDDILVASPDMETHLKDLQILFERLEKTGIRLNKNKCECLKSEIEYLGHVINAQGIQPARAKVEAILAAPEPQNLDQLRSLLGLINYYRKFIPNLSTVVAPLNDLLTKNCTWNWDRNAMEAYRKVKELIAAPTILTHYSPELETVVAADASPWGLGAIISQIDKEGVERPIAFASRTLTPTEKNYSQIDKEALGIIFALRKFHLYIYGRKFTLLTDHKPLTHIFDKGKQIPTLAANRLQRWAIILSAYHYDIKYRPSKLHCNVDALSRLPCPLELPISCAEMELPTLLIAQIDDFPLTHKQIAFESAQDDLLKQVLQFTQNGWPRTSMQSLTKYHNIRDELSIQEGCLLWADRVVIPKRLQKRLLDELHKNHTGIVRMKMLARSLFWWPGLDKDIEQVTQKCSACLLFAKDPPKAPLHPWIKPSDPWERIHVDFAGPIAGHTFLVLVDAHSKWPEVVSMPTTDSTHTMLVLENYFTRYGYPVHIVSDNGTQFTSDAFNIYCKNRGIQHTFSPPFHPASNGQAERFVQTLKNFLYRLDNFSNLTIKINDLLFTYRSTPSTSTGKTPAELFLGRPLRNRLRLVKPPTGTSPTYTPEYTKNLRTFKVGDHVRARMYSLSKLDKRWKPGIVDKVLGPVTYIINLGEGRMTKRHIDQLRSLPHPLEPDRRASADEDWHQPSCAPDTPPVDRQPPRYPSRTRHPPLRFKNQ